MEHSFKIIFTGEILPGHDIYKVKQELAAILKTDNVEINAFFKKQRQFVKDRLDFVTAARYRESFKLAGAVCYILAMTDCPVCLHRQKKSDKCTKCCFDNKYCCDPDKQTISIPEPENNNNAGLINKKTEKDTGADNPDREKYKDRAINNIRIGTILLSTAFFMDWILQNIFYLDLAWIYLLGLPHLVYGSFYFAKLKGYPAKLGLISITSLLGLSILLLLPDKNAPQVQQRFLSKERFIGALMIIISLSWAFQEYLTFSNMKKIDLKKEEINELSRSPDSSYPFNYNLMAVRSHVNNCFTFAMNHDLRPKESYRVAKALLDGLSDFFVNMQYQRFLRYHKGKIADHNYSEKNIERLKTEYDQLVQRKRRVISDNYIYKDIGLWRLSYNYKGFMSDEDCLPIIHYNEAEKNLRDLIRSYARENGDILPNDLDEMDKFFAKSNKNRYLTKYKNQYEKIKKLINVTFDPSAEQITLILTDKAGIIAGQTVVLGLIITEPSANRSKWYECIRIGGTLSDKYRSLSFTFKGHPFL